MDRLRLRRAFIHILSGLVAPTYTISGVVYDADGTTAVAGATITLGALTATSGADGTYTISNIPAGTSGSMTCTKTGYSWIAITVAAMSGNLTAQNYTNEWWAAGGCAASCVLAYRSIGVASQAISYVNLANPGPNDLSSPAAPTWDAANGWIFNGSSQYLTTGYTPAAAQTKSLFVRFSGAATSGASRIVAGEAGAVPRARLWIYTISTDNKFFFANGQSDEAGNASVAAGVLGIAGMAGWHDGIKVKTLTGTAGTESAVMTIGAANLAGTVGTWFGGNVQAFCEYSATITDAQAAAVSAAMAALTNP